MENKKLKWCERMKSLGTPQNHLLVESRTAMEWGAHMASPWAHRQATPQGGKLTHQAHCHLGFHLEVLATVSPGGGSGTDGMPSQELHRGV